MSFQDDSARLWRLARSLADDGDAASPEEAAKDGEALIRVQARATEAERLLRRAYADTHPEDVPLDVLRWLNS